MRADDWTAANEVSNRRQGAQGTYDAASQAALDNEFGTHVDEDVIKAILENGTAQEATVSPTRPLPFPGPIQVRLVGRAMTSTIP